MNRGRIPGFQSSCPQQGSREAAPRALSGCGQTPSWGAQGLGAAAGGQRQTGIEPFPTAACPSWPEKPLYPSHKAQIPFLPHRSQQCVTFFFSCLLHFQAHPLLSPRTFLRPNKSCFLCLSFHPLPIPGYFAGLCRIPLHQSICKCSYKYKWRGNSSGSGANQQRNELGMRRQQAVWEWLRENEIHNSLEEKRKKSQLKRLLERENSDKEQE